MTRRLVRPVLHIVSLVMIVSMVCALAPMAHSQGRKKLTWGFVDGTNCLDPAFQTGTPDYNNIMNIYNSVVTHKPGTLTEVSPDLAERWTVSPDNTVYTFHLRSGVKWHEGYGELTAQDVKYSWDRILDPATKARYGVEIGAIKSVDVIDPRTVRVTLRYPFSTFLINLAHSGASGIVNRRAVEERGNAHCLRPIGTGPYRVVRAETRGGVQMVAFDEYFRGRPKIDEVEMRVIPEESVAVLALRNGEIDFMFVTEPPNMTALRKVPNVFVNAEQNFSARIFALWLNNSRKPFNDVRVRRALIHALQRQVIVREVTEGLVTRVAHSIVPPSLFGHTDDVMKYDFSPATARRLLREAGYPNGFRTSVISFNTEVYPATLTIVQAMWKQIGVTLDVEFLERAALRARQASGDYDINVSDPTRAEVGLILDFFDGRNAPPNGIAFSMYKGVDDLIAAQAREVNPRRRSDIIKKIQQQIAIDAPVIPLWYGLQVTAARTYVKGLIPNLGWWQTRFYLFDIER